eukprot:1141174-Pelagomonas_calceolata.AAC.7
MRAWYTTATAIWQALTQYGMHPGHTQHDGVPSKASQAQQITHTLTLKGVLSSKWIPSEYV